MAAKILHLLSSAVEEAIEADDPVTVEAIAERVGMSRFQLAREFRRAGWGRPSDFTRAQRLRCAKNLLAETEDPPKTIAHRCGFRSFSTFARQFKAKYGMTPSEYRTRTK